MGLALATSFWLVSPHLRAPSDVFFAFGVGVVVGLVIFAPIVAALAFNKQMRPWAVTHAFAVRWYASILMVFSLGYLVASVAHQTADTLTGLAVIAVLLGALTKVVFGIIFRGGDEPPSNGNRGPRPPLAPVPRPTGPRRLIFCEAAEIEKPTA